MKRNKVDKKKKKERRKKKKEKIESKANRINLERQKSLLGR